MDSNFIFRCLFIVIFFSFIGYFTKKQNEIDAIEQKSFDSELSMLKDSIYYLNQKLDALNFSCKKDTTIVIPKGGSLCGTLKISETEALALAKKFNYPVRYNSWGKSNVIIQPGEKFSKTWQPDLIKYLEPKNKK